MTEFSLETLALRGTTHANAATVDAVICPDGEIRIVVTEDSQTSTIVECDHADVQSTD